MRTFISPSPRWCKRSAARSRCHPGSSSPTSRLPVVDVDEMGYLPADEIVSVDEARNSPDAVG